MYIYICIHIYMYISLCLRIHMYVYITIYICMKARGSKEGMEGNFDAILLESTLAKQNALKEGAFVRVFCMHVVVSMCVGKSDR